MLLYFFVQQQIFPFAINVFLLCGALFVLCMYCQNQLIISKPNNHRYLTVFYVIISLGSFVGGFCTSWIIPLISTSLIEYLFGLILIAITISLGDSTKHRAHIIRLVTYYILFFMLWPIAFVKYNIWGLLLIVYVTKKAYSEFAKDRFALVCSFVFILLTTPVSEMLWMKNFSFYKKRNYYGIYRVLDGPYIRELYNGVTLHGAQAHEEGRKPEPITYYSLKSPIGEIMTSDVFNFHRIGVFGLGIGTIATYTRGDQIIDFYELDPDVHTIADLFFTYIRNSAGKINYIYGDARVSLERNTDVKYDLLIIDAFGGDAIPTHLLTKEAIALYRSRMSDQGILLIHISNRFVDLKPVIARNAFLLNARVCFKYKKNPSSRTLPSEWMALTWDQDHFKILDRDFKWASFTRKKVEKYRPWTDQYSNILPIIKVKVLVNSIKHFQPFNW